MATISYSHCEAILASVRMRQIQVMQGAWQGRCYIYITLTMGVRIAFASVLLVILAYLAGRRQPSTSNLDSVLRGLLREEGFRTVNGKNRVTVGFGSCIDYFSNAVDVVNALNLDPPDSPSHHDVISSSKDLAEAFAFHFRHGGAAE